MKFTKLTKRLGRTINVRDHDFLKIEAELTAEFDSEHETYEEVDQKLFERCKQSLNADLKRFKEGNKKQ